MGTLTQERTRDELDPSNPRVVMLAGDWHGDLDWARRMIEFAGACRVDRIYHMGDFGVWPGDSGRYFLDEVEKKAAEFGLELWVTPGNHEDYGQILATPVGEHGLQWIRQHVALIPRGHRWWHGGRTFVSLGGAPSIDYEWRTIGQSWWREEQITLAEAQGVADEGYADVMLAHDAPDGSTSAIERILSSPGGWSAKGLAYAAEGRHLMNLAVAGVRPSLFAHGHYHVQDDTGPQVPTRYVALHMQSEPGNVCLLNLSTMKITWDGRTWL